MRCGLATSGPPQSLEQKGTEDGCGGSLPKLPWRVDDAVAWSKTVEPPLPSMIEATGLTGMSSKFRIVVFEVAIAGDSQQPLKMLPCRGGSEVRCEVTCVLSLSGQVWR
mmetsp:Transcript_145555/g.264959  ORF Transcript_145555/g.264959 Transcript_145555/m.264959 type:complete len:109 (-) Transcript_145555:3-329(-)